jgi:hypothetical protein
VALVRDVVKLSITKRCFGDSVKGQGLTMEYRLAERCREMGWCVGIQLSSLSLTVPEVMCTFKVCILAFSGMRGHVC